MKKLAVIGAIALIIFGCVLAAGCTSSTQQTASTTACPVVGQWVTQMNFSGEPHYVIQTIKKDGTGYWMVLENDIPGLNIIHFYSSEFDKNDHDGTFDKKSSDGNTYQMVFDPKQNTLTETISANETLTYTKADPIVGSWYGQASGTEDGITSPIFKPDGTGITTVSFKDKGTAIVSSFTWKKNTDGTYAVEYKAGDKRTYTVDSTGNKMLSSGGSTKQRAFLNDTFMVSITGTWYNSDSTKSAVFNADNTGFYYGPKYGLKNFTWKMNEPGKFSVTYTDGKAESDGSSLKDITYEWTYDRENETFTDGTNVLFTRPQETVEDRFTIYLQ